MLKFSPANAKTKALREVPELGKWLRHKRKIYSLDTLSGHNCPFAKECLSKAVVQPDGRRKIVDGKHTKFRCFSASQEALFPGVYNLRKHNADLLKAVKSSSLKMRDLLQEGMPKNLGICRIHVAGDMFNQRYFDAWLRMAKANPDKLFYAYTKSLPFWVARQFKMPDNFVMTASRGGSRDDLIKTEFLREAIVVYSEEEADSLGLPIDHDDSHAAVPEWRNNSFALLIHGTQPAGSEASFALKKLKGKGSYS